MNPSIEPAQNPNLSQFPINLPRPHRLARRSFLRSLGLGAALLVPGASLLGESTRSRARTYEYDRLGLCGVETAPPCYPVPKAMGENQESSKLSLRHERSTRYLLAADSSIVRSLRARA